jgi:hypothetical protein
VIRTEPRAIRLVDLSGNPAEQSAGYDPPKELPIHTAIYLNRPEVGAVVHAHPRSAVLCGLAGLNPQPVVGAYNIPALHMALAGIPVFPRSVLITRAELADQMVEFMGQTQVCILRGHGIVAVGDTVEAAMLGAEPTPVPDEDLAELPDLGGHFNDILGWRALVSETLHQSSSGPRSESRFENALNDGSKWS